MSRKEWAAVLVVIGVGIVLQIPGHDDAMMDHDTMDRAGAQQSGMGAAMPDAARENARLVTVALDVTGMT